jgi:hypothetical protein
MTSESEARRRYLVNRLYSLRGLIAEYVGDKAGLIDLRIIQRQVRDECLEKFGSVPDAAELEAHGLQVERETAAQAKINRGKHYEKTGVVVSEQ